MHFQSSTIGELAKALAKAQGELHAASKDATNPHFKNRYADLASVWDACRAPLSKHGLAVSQLSDRGEDGSVRLTTILMHESGEHIGSTMSVRPSQENPQVVGSILTYLRRYALASAVGVVADDDDGEAGTAPVRSAAQERRQPAPVAPPTSTPAEPPKTLREAAERVQRAFPGASEPEYHRSTDCPECGGPMWDNREKKTNPKAPDMKCKDKGCTGVIWKYKAPPAPNPIPGGFLEQDAQLPPDEIPF
ncbi:MAG: ERF family protein [Ilumatobacteraceae bacterium]